MTQKEFEEICAARKTAYKQKLAELHTQIHAARKEYRAGNEELNKELKAARRADPRQKKKRECYRLKAHISHLLQDWQGAVLDTQTAASHFNCCGDEAAIFEIVIPLRPAE